MLVDNSTSRAYVASPLLRRGRERATRTINPKTLHSLFFLCAVLLNSIELKAQTITTFAGNGTLGNTIDGSSATASAIGEPDGCKFDSHGNFYFTQVVPDKVFKITPSGIITTVAGTSSGGYNGDGIAATAAKLNGPGAIAFDSLGNIYIADGINSRVRRVDAMTGIISTIAGNGTSGFSGDGGPATAAVFSGVADLCFDQAENLYVVDAGNDRVRKINTTGVITTVAGNGSAGPSSGDGGQATAANIGGVQGICIDITGNLYLAIPGDAVIRKINTTGIISTIAGNGSAGPSGDGGPATAASLGEIMLVANNYGNLFVSGFIDNDVRVIDKYGIINTIAGTAVYGYSGDNGPATLAQLSSTYGIALDTCGNVYIADKDNHRIRKITLNPMCVNERVNTVKNEETVNIYPNPANDQLHIDNVKTQTTYRLLSIVGTVAQQGNLKEGNNSISMQVIANGMYVLELTDDEGKRTVTKIIKQ